MLILALSIFVAQTPPELSPPPTPPLEEIADDPPAAPPMPAVPMTSAPPSATQLAEKMPEALVEQGNPAIRSFVTACVAASTFATVLGASIGYVALDHTKSGDEAVLVFGLPLAVVGGALSAMVAHKVQHGQGSLLSAMGGALLGAVVSGALAYAIVSQSDAHSAGTWVGAGVLIAGGVGAGAAWAIERSNQNAIDESKPQLSLAPVRGGAAASLRFSW